MTDQLDRMLRAHDPAASPAARAEADDLRARLDARLDELPSAATESVPRSPARFGRRAVGLVAAAAAVSTAYLLLPVGQTNAYATWTATPQAVAERDAEVAVQECRDAMSGPFWSRSAGGPEEFDPIAATVMLTERRGDVVSVLLWDEGPMKEFAGSCLVELEPGASSGKVHGTAVGGATGGAPSLPPVDGFLEGSMSQDGMDDPISMLTGRVGADVVGLTVHADGVTAEASIDNGLYAVWFPGRVFPDEPLPPSGEGGPEPMITYDLTLSDGTVITDAQPALPS